MSVKRHAISGSISALNFFLQWIGCYLLWKAYNWRNLTTQSLLIFHVCVCECLISSVWLVIYFILTPTGYGLHTSYYGYCFVIHLAFNAVLYKIMLFMTLDRLMAVLLSLRYPQYWTVNRTKKMLSVIWSIGCVEIVCFVIFVNRFGTWYRSLGLVYVTLTFRILFICIALITYSVIFWKYRKSIDIARHQNLSGNDRRTRTSALQTFLKSRFYISALIILTYIFFNTIPFFALISSVEDVYDRSSQKELAVGILLQLGYTADAVIYIFLQKNVRNQLIKMICCGQGTNGAIDENTATSVIADQVQGGIAVSATII